MIVGINFTGRPEDIALLEQTRLIAKLKLTQRSDDGTLLRLQGITDDSRIATTMEIQASNGRRIIKSVLSRSGKYIGIYCS